MRSVLFTICLFAFVFAYSQETDSDIFQTSKGDLSIQPIIHGTLMLQWQDEVIYVDPYGGGERFADLPDPTVILITDIHGDHLNLKTLEAINTSDVHFIVPQAVADKLPATMKASISILDNMTSASYADINIQAIPMYNLPETNKSRHPKGRGNGYVLTFADKQLYISGDTEDIKEMRALKNIDIAFVCMNLPYTMDVDQAADAVNEFQPKVVYPYHYRGKGGLSDLEVFTLLVEERSPNVEVRLRNWYSE